MAEQIRKFVDLDCWKACRALRLYVARQIIPVIPNDERYRLGDQMLRAARSTTANIAEGFGRYHYMDNAKFISNARGSCWEVLDHLITAHDEKMIDKQRLLQGHDPVEAAVKLLNGYLRYLRTQAKPHPPPTTHHPITNNQ